MDCYNTGSEFIESLDFLSPPVKRIDSSRQASGSACNSDKNDVRLLRGLRNTFFAPPPSFAKHTNTVYNTESTTSLILKKTSERKILGQQYSFASFPCLEKPQNEISTLPKAEKKTNTSRKPLIKVTVIPKKDQVQAAKLLRRRRYIPKRIQSTTSNHENTILTKNVYLVVAGRRREKVYEIKTTGSAKFSTDHDSYSKNEDIPVSELTNFQQLIQSLKMERKKKKEKSPAAADTSEAPHTVDWSNYQKRVNCMNKESRDRQAPKKSRVRIFGQIGISDEDKYVLRYGATVDDKTVMSDVAQLTRDFSHVLADASYATTGQQSPQQQDSCLQADYNYDLDIEKLPVSDAVSKESQGTQVDFNIEVPAAKGRSAVFADKKVQYNCCGNRSDPNTLKDCQSPIVIISVYPKVSPKDAMNPVPSVTARTTSPTAVNTNSSNHGLKTEKAPTKIDTRRNTKSPRIQSRSPSPVRKASKPKLPDNSTKGPVREKRSPDRQKALRAIKEKIREKDKLKQDASLRKPPLKVTVSHGTQVTKSIQNLTVSNATQLSKKNQRLNTASQGTQMSKDYYQVPNKSNETQVSANRIQNYTASSATQYSNDAQSSTASTQCEDTINSQQDIAPVKHSVNDTITYMSKRYQHPQFSAITHFKTQVSNATQVPAQQFYSGQSTQVSKSGKPETIAIETQVYKDQETFNSKPAQVFKSEQTSKYTSKGRAESGTNTDHAQTKKAMVETYTKKLTEQIIQKQFDGARLDNSKVRVNIECDRDYYDVLFNRDTLATDLRIRKTLKDMDPQQCENEPSMGGWPRLPDSAIRRGFHTGNKSPTRSPPVAVYNNPSDDALMKTVSRLTIRDSLEICHRREDKNSNNNNKNAQTYFPAQLSDGVDEETVFSAPMKHFVGDDCSISDPVERDRQIRELLGVKPNHSKTSQGRFCENDGIPYQCIYRKQCKESQVTEINFEFTKLCPCYQPQQRKKPNVSVSVQCRQKSCKTRLLKENAGDGRYTNKCYINYTAEGRSENKDDKKSAIYQQLVLNRNIQVFLQVEQFSKQRPVVLSRQQYDKVRKTIQKTISTKRSYQNGKRQKLMGKSDGNCNSSEISIGEVRTKKFKDPEQLKKKANVQGKGTCLYESLSNGERPSGCCEIAAQTDPIRCDKKNCRLAKAARKTKTHKPNIDMKGDFLDQSPVPSETRSKKSKKTEDVKTIIKPRLGTVIGQDLGVGDTPKQPKTGKKKDGSVCYECDKESDKGSELQTYVLFNAQRDKLKDAKETENVTHTRRTLSSVEIHYASVSFMKQIAHSSTNVGALSNSSLDHLNSFHTLFRGHRKCATPNLGTSVLSLYSKEGYNSENKCVKLEPQVSKPRKPFLRRLMSCLVMRSTRDLQLPIGPQPDLPSVNSSIDSYHISTSLGAMEVSSSIYDTSASFYSNHTILPVNSKIKRGFFSSVRGFLTNRKS